MLALKKKKLILASISFLILLVPIGLIFSSVSVTGTEGKVVIFARQFEFTPSRIDARIGDTITFVLQSNDSRHGFYIQELGVDVEVNVQAPTVVSVKIDRSGTFLFVCNIPCGNYHPYMNGKLEVSPNIPYIIMVSAISLLTSYTVWTTGRELSDDRTFTKLETIEEGLE